MFAASLQMGAKPPPPRNVFGRRLARLAMVMLFFAAMVEIVIVRMTRGKSRGGASVG